MITLVLNPDFIQNTGCYPIFNTFERIQFYTCPAWVIRMFPWIKNSLNWTTVCSVPAATSKFCLSWINLNVLFVGQFQDRELLSIPCLTLLIGSHLGLVVWPRSVHQSLFLRFLVRNEQCLETVLQSLKQDVVPNSDYGMRLGVNVVTLSHAAIAEDPAYSQCMVARRLTIHNDLKNLHPRDHVYVNLVSADLQEKVTVKSIFFFSL